MAVLYLICWSIQYIQYIIYMIFIDLLIVVYLFVLAWFHGPFSVRKTCRCWPHWKHQRCASFGFCSGCLRRCGWLQRGWRWQASISISLRLRSAKWRCRSSFEDGCWEGRKRLSSAGNSTCCAGFCQAIVFVKLKGRRQPILGFCEQLPQAILKAIL